MTDGLSPFGADSSIVQYSNGKWTQIDSGGAYQTREFNATVSFSFNGTTITILGTLQPDRLAQTATANSPLIYVLDGEDDHTFLFNASSPTIYSSPRLLQGPHSLAIRLANDNTTFSVSGGSVATAQPESANHRRTIAIVAGTLGGFVVLSLVFVALFLFYRRRRRHSPTLYALGPLQANLPATKEAFTSPKYSNYGLSFTQSTDSVNYLPKPLVKAVTRPSSVPIPGVHDSYTPVVPRAKHKLKPKVKPTPAAPPTRMS
ncbi:hypothetical protein GGX14DRAFT_94990 [Mycena pura]|uniref:Transmembrane protein n=1 Tax=Mycena pura TaxID=153505 RepID=A0AAD6VG39_9AGAR|nr:hypothetical protein GGX14DRAFT_94990 [Mycena pura]